MPYTVTQDLEQAAGGAARLVELADWDGDGEADAAALAAAQAKADGLIDSYAAMRYATPIASPSAILVQQAADEAIYQLKSRRGMVTAQDVEERTARMEWLEQLSKGRVRPDEPLPPKSSAVAARHSISNRAVSREKTKGFW